MGTTACTTAAPMPITSTPAFTSAPAPTAGSSVDSTSGGGAPGQSPIQAPPTKGGGDIVGGGGSDQFAAAITALSAAIQQLSAAIQALQAGGAVSGGGQTAPSGCGTPGCTMPNCGSMATGGGLAPASQVSTGASTIGVAPPSGAQPPSPQGVDAVTGGGSSAPTETNGAGGAPEAHGHSH